jgi:hypothetical protein
VAQAALPSSNGYWIQSQCWTCTPSPCWMNHGPKDFTEKSMVIPIPQYKFCNHFQSERIEFEWLPVPTTQRFYGFDPWPGCQIGNDQFKIVVWVMRR